jgi:ABC-type thiamine transport system substrate-binding protein
MSVLASRARKTLRDWSFAACTIGASLLAGIAIARADQKLVIYSANDSTLNDLVFNAFTKETGIQVETVSTGSGVLMKRIQAEKDNPQGDIIWGVSRSLLQTNRRISRRMYRRKSRRSPRISSIPIICGPAPTCISSW